MQKWKRCGKCCVSPKTIFLPVAGSDSPKRAAGQSMGTKGTAIGLPIPRWRYPSDAPKHFFQLESRDS